MDTFIVRVWTAGEGTAPPAGDPHLRGVVEHVRSGSETVFQDPAELLAFLEGGGGPSGKG